MDDDVAEVHEDPAPLGVALDADRLPPRARSFLDEAARDRLHLPLAPSARDDEDVGHLRERRHVEDRDVLGLLVERRLDDEVGERARAQLRGDGLPSARYRPRSSM